MKNCYAYFYFLFSINAIFYLIKNERYIFEDDQYILVDN